MVNITAKKEIGLKGVYRVLGNLTARVLSRTFKPFNPNIITIAGFTVYITGVGFFAVYGRKITNGMLAFILGTQLALILDFADGSYARMVNRTSRLGHLLDSLVGTLEVSVLFLVAYLVADGPVERFIIFGLLLIFAFDQRVRLLKASYRKDSQLVKEKTTLTKRNIWSYLVKIPLGFGFAHFYLYLTLWFLFRSICFLFVLYITGLSSIIRRVRLVRAELLGGGETVQLMLEGNEHE